MTSSTATLSPGVATILATTPSCAATTTFSIFIASTGWFRSERENVDEDVCEVGQGLARVEIDLMEPIDPDGKPAVHVPPLNHVGLWIDDLRAAVAWLEANGVRMAPGGIRTGASGHDICFIHPRPNDAFPIAGAGVLIELVQAPPEVVAAWCAQRDEATLEAGPGPR